MDGITRAQARDSFPATTKKEQAFHARDFGLRSCIFTKRLTCENFPSSDKLRDNEHILSKEQFDTARGIVQYKQIWCGVAEQEKEVYFTCPSAL